MMGNGDFSQLYRNALAERDPEQKAVLLRGVQERLDQWAQAVQLPDSGPGRVSVAAMHMTRQPSMPGRGEHERSVSSAA